MKKYFVVTFFLLIFNTLFAQSKAELLVEESIAYHDPENNWYKLNANISITSIVERNDLQDTSQREILMDLANGRFVMKQDTIVYEFPCDDCERATMYNNYFRYLLGLPMKLKDKGTIIHDDIRTMSYKDEEYRVVTVTYDPAVGTDTWLFYFQMEKPELSIIEFSKDGTFQNGETIELNDKVKFQNILLPGQLKWFVLPDRPFLAEENIKYSNASNK